MLFLGALLGAAAIGAAGSITGSALSYKIAKENREWQERMSNTAYQRSMKDMRLAGLNPMLAYSQGPAGTPGGAVSTVDDPTASARDALRQVQEAKTRKADRELAEEKLGTERAQQGALHAQQTASYEQAGLAH